MKKIKKLLIENSIKDVVILNGNEFNFKSTKEGGRYIIKNFESNQKVTLLKEVGFFNKTDSELFFIHHYLQNGIKKYKIVDLPIDKDRDYELAYDFVNDDSIKGREDMSEIIEESNNETDYVSFIKEVKDILSYEETSDNDGKKYAVEFRLLDKYFDWDAKQAKKKSKFVPRKQDLRGVINIKVDGYFDKHDSKPQQWIVCKIKGSWETSSKNHKMNFDNNDQRGWAIGKVDFQMEDLHEKNNCVFYNDSIPKNKNNSHDINETTSFDITVDTEKKVAAKFNISERVTYTYKDWDCIQKSFSHWLFRQGFPSKGDYWKCPKSAFDTFDNDVKPLPDLSKHTTYFDIVSTWKTDRVLKDRLPLNFRIETQYNYLGANWGKQYWWGYRIWQNLSFDLDMSKIK